MAQLPTVAIIGRPNTGKSTLFNRMVGHRKAIVSDEPGTTRDHVAERIEAEVDYLLIDTGGMGVTRDKDFETDVFEQSLLALEHADVILLTLNGKEELTKDDHTIVDLLRTKRQRHVPVLVVATKMDHPDVTPDELSDFYKLKISEEVLAVSAFHNRGIDELKKLIVSHLKKLHFKKSQVSSLRSQVSRIAIIGKPNVGKSSIVNALMSEPERAKHPMLVSEVPGTTRDAVDTVVRSQGRQYVLLDTAGLKKNAQTKEEIERYAMLRTIQAVESADVAVLVLDAMKSVSQQDKRIASLAIQEGKGLIVLVNKADTIKADQRKKKVQEVQALLPFCRFAKVILTSAKTKEGLLKLFEAVDAVQRNRERRLPVKELRQWFDRAVHGQPLGQIAKSKHITQAADVPPTFVVFVKNPKHVSVSQLRFLDNRLRTTFGFEGTPVRWVTKATD